MIARTRKAPQNIAYEKFQCKNKLRQKTFEITSEEPTMEPQWEATCGGHQEEKESDNQSDAPSVGGPS